MKGSEAPDEVYGVDSDDLASGETLGEEVEGVAVVGVVEGGDEDDGVGDVEVGVAGGEALVFEEDGFGHGEFADVEGLAVEVAGLAEADEVFGEGQVIFVGGVGLDAGEDGVFPDEAGDVVDVAVGVVSGGAAVEPEGVFDAEIVVEGLFEGLAGLRLVAEAGVAFLDFAEEAFFGGEEDAGSVGVDASAFEDEALGAFGGLGLGAELLDGVEFGYVVGDEVVAAVIVVLGPGVELPVGEGEVAGGILEEDGAGVAEPDAVGGPVVEVEAGHVGSVAAEHSGGAGLFGQAVYEEVDVFDAGEMADDFGVDPGDGLELVGPVFGVVGPGEPGSGVGCPLGGHAEA